MQHYVLEQRVRQENLPISLNNFAITARFQATVRALSSSLPLDGNVDPQILWKTILLLVEWLVEPQMFYFHLPHLLRLKHPGFVSPANEWRRLLESPSARSLYMEGPTLCTEVYFLLFQQLTHLSLVFAVSIRHFAVLLTAKSGKRVSHGLPQAKPRRTPTSSEDHESPSWEVRKKCNEK